jgi:hypothetical protein
MDGQVAPQTPHRPTSGRSVAEIERRSGARWLFQSVQEFGSLDRLDVTEIERILNG